MQCPVCDTPWEMRHTERLRKVEPPLYVLVSRWLCSYCGNIFETRQEYKHVGNRQRAVRRRIYEEKYGDEQMPKM